MQSFNKAELKRIKQISAENAERMNDVYRYLSGRVEWVVGICDHWVRVLESLGERNRGYVEELEGVMNYSPSELVADDFRNIVASPDFSKIGVVMANFAGEKVEQERRLWGECIEPIRREFGRLVEHQGVIRATVLERTDGLRMDVVADMRKMDSYLSECVDLTTLSARLRQKFSVDEQKNRKLIAKLEKTNERMTSNYVKCLMVGLSLNHMLRHYRTECFHQLLGFLNTGLRERVGAILDLILRTTKEHADLPLLDRTYLDACFTAEFDSEDLPQICFREYTLPAPTLESSRLANDIAEKVGVLKNLRVQLLAKEDKLRAALSSPSSQQSLRSFASVDSHLFTTRWYLEKISAEIKIYCVMLAGDTLPRLASETSISHFDSMFGFGRKVGAHRLLMFGGRIQDASPPHDIHPVILVCVRHMRRLGLGSKGLFRISGSQLKTARLMACLEGGIEVVDSSINTYASVFKAYFRGMSCCPIPLALFQEIVPELGSHQSDFAQIGKIKKILFSLDKTAWLRLRYKFHFLADVASHSELGQMDPKNLGTVFGMLYTSYFPDNFEIHREIPQIVELLIAHSHDIFPSSISGLCYPAGLDYEEGSESPGEAGFVPFVESCSPLDLRSGDPVATLRTDFDNSTFNGILQRREEGESFDGNEHSFSKNP